MKRRTSSFPWIWVLLALIVAGLEIWQRTLPQAMPPPIEEDGRFVTLHRPRLVESGGNDGDSFEIAHDGGSHVVRLYFVDCPEKRKYKLVEDRLKDQSSYFGISLAATLRIGTQAQEFTLSLLRRRPFRVISRMDRVYDSDRVYAMVFFEDGEALSEKLVKAGLCRIHTRGTQLPDGRSEFEFQQHLRELERKAREEKLGAWGARSSKK